jgi:hypothetical protein
MKRFFSRKKLRKSKSEVEKSLGNGNGTVAVDIRPSKSTNIVKWVELLIKKPSFLSNVASSSDDWEAVCSSRGEERAKNFDSELDKHMMQTITDVKYMIKKSKYTAMSMFPLK